MTNLSGILHGPGFDFSRQREVQRHDNIDKFSRRVAPSAHCLAQTVEQEGNFFSCFRLYSAPITNLWVLSAGKPGRAFLTVVL